MSMYTKFVNHSHNITLAICMQKIQILLGHVKRTAIIAIAKMEKRSTWVLFRTIFSAQGKQLDQDALANRQRHLEALASIEQHRQAILNRRSGQTFQFDVVAMLEQIRDERDAELTCSQSNSV